MIRKTLTIVSLVGLLLSVGLWAASYFHLVFTPPYTNGNDLMIRVDYGTVRAYYDKHEIGDNFKRPSYPIASISGFNGFETHWLHFMWYKDRDFAVSYVVIVPLWIPTVLFAAMFWWSFLPRHRRRKRKKLGLCLKCGYDLRGSKERCPECNTQFDHANLGQDDLRSWRVRFLGATRHYSSLVVPLLMILVVLMAFVIGSCLP